MRVNASSYLTPTSPPDVSPLLQGMSSSRLTIAGRMALLDGPDAAEAKKAFLAKNPQSFWVEFGDFSWFRMDSIATARLVGGFGRIKQVPQTTFLLALDIGLIRMPLLP